VFTLKRYRCSRSSGMGVHVGPEYAEIVFRIIVSAVASFLTMWVVFMLYLFFNPDAETPRKRTKFGEKERK
jgi:uncharacterized BrkB/YihY/UPF0761 family membrane protein